VLKDSPIQKLEDSGKTIGAPSFGAGGGLGLKQNLSESHHDQSVHRIATAPGPRRRGAARGQIDALVIGTSCRRAEIPGCAAHLISR